MILIPCATVLNQTMIRGRKSGRPRVRQHVRSFSPVQEDRAGERVALPPRVIPKKMDVQLIKDFRAEFSLWQPEIQSLVC